MSEENMTNGIVRSTVDDIRTPGPEKELEHKTKDFLSSNGSLDVKNCFAGAPKSLSRLEGTFDDLECHGFTKVPFTANKKIPKRNILEFEGSKIKHEENVNFLPNQSSHIGRAKVVSEEKIVKMRTNVTSATTGNFYKMNWYKVKAGWSNGSQALDISSQSSTAASVEAFLDPSVNRSATHKMTDDSQSLYTSNDSRSYTSSVLFSLVPPISPAYERTDGSLQSMNTRNNNRIVTSDEGSLSLNISKFSYIYLKSTQSMHYSKRVLSCRHRCGQEYSFPCSCEEKCVVHKTCCEDLAEACPELYNQALTKLRHLLFESVRCDSMSAVFMVESCPLGLHTEGDDLSQNPVYVASDENPDDMEKGKEFSLSEIVSNAPVTDFETGIIYANASIYDCNKQNKSSSFSQTLSGIVQAWNTQIGTAHQVTPDRIEDLNTQLDLSTYSYIPRNSPIISSSLCYTEETISCIIMISNEVGIHDLTCDETVTTYYSNRNNYLIFPLNDHLNILDKVCGVCLSEYQGDVDKGNRYFLTGFKVLMAPSETLGQLMYDLPFELRINKKGTPWWSWSCSTPDQANMSCRVLACDPRYLLVGANLCRRQVEAELSIQSEILIKGKTCRIDHEAFAEAIKCCLQSLYKLKAANQYYRFYQIYSVPENVNLTTVRMKMYFDDSYFNNYLIKLRRGYLPLYTAMLVFAQQHCLLNGERIEWRNFTIEKLLKTLSQQTSTGRYTRVAERVHSLTIEDIRTIETLLNHFVYRVCVQFIRIDKSLDDEMWCEHRIDKNYGMLEVKLDDVVSELRNLQCFTSIEADIEHKSSITKMRVSLLLLCFIILVTLFTK